MSTFVCTSFRLSFFIESQFSVLLLRFFVKVKTFKVFIFYIVQDCFSPCVLIHQNLLWSLVFGYFACLQSIIPSNCEIWFFGQKGKVRTLCLVSSVSFKPTSTLRFLNRYLYWLFFQMVQQQQIH